MTVSSYPLSQLTPLLALERLHCLMHGGVDAFFIDDLLNLAAPEKAMCRISPSNPASKLASLATWGRATEAVTSRKGASE